MNESSIKPKRCSRKSDLAIYSLHARVTSLCFARVPSPSRHPATLACLAEILTSQPLAAWLQLGRSSLGEDVEELIEIATMLVEESGPALPPCR